MPDKHEKDDDDDAALSILLSSVPSASLDTPLPSSSFGYRMLVLQGWRGMGHGLGRLQQGIAEPIRINLDGETRLGLGKETEINTVAQAATGARRRMEVESQMDEDEQQRSQRAALASTAAAAEQSRQAALATLRCDDCNKQYTLALHYEAHLSSYDHNHTIRLKEVRRSEAARRVAMARAQQEETNMQTTTTGEPFKTKEERRREEKEQAMLEAHMKAAAAAAMPIQPQPAASAIQPSTAAPPSAAPMAPVAFRMNMKPLGVVMKKPILVQKPKFGFSAE